MRRTLAFVVVLAIVVASGVGAFVLLLADIQGEDKPSCDLDDVTRRVASDGLGRATESDIEDFPIPESVQLQCGAGRVKGGRFDANLRFYVLPDGATIGALDQWYAGRELEGRPFEQYEWCGVRMFEPPARVALWKDVEADRVLQLGLYADTDPLFGDPSGGRTIVSVGTYRLSNNPYLEFAPVC